MGRRAVDTPTRRIFPQQRKTLLKSLAAPRVESKMGTVGYFRSYTHSPLRRFTAFSPPNVIATAHQ